jgi:hypothetical protein
MVVSSFTYHAFAQGSDVTATDDAVVAEVSDVTSDSSVEVASASSEDVDDAASSELFVSGDWKSGITGSGLVDKTTVSATDSSVNLAITPADGKAAGKTTNGEDTLLYYTQEVNGDYDFTLSGDIVVNKLNTLTDSNPHQTGFGIGVFDNLWYDELYMSGAYAGYYASSSKASQGSISYFARTNNSGKGDKRTKIGDYTKLDATVTAPTDPYSFSLTKSGQFVTITVGDETYSYEFSEAELSGNVYPMFYVARNADITVSNIKFEQATKKVTSIEVDASSAKKDFVLNEDFSTDGLKVIATYDDGSKEEVTDYNVSGYDAKSVTTQTITVSKGTAKATYEVTVNPITVTGLKVTNVPYNTAYYNGTYFSATGIEVTAELNDGSTVTYGASSEELHYTLDGVELTSETYFNNNFKAGDKEVVVTLGDVDGLIIKDGVQATFKATVSTADFTAIAIVTKPETEFYFIGDELDLNGLVVKAGYADGRSEIISDEFYTVSGFDSTTTGTKTITVASTINPSLTATFDVVVNEVYPVGLTIASYPQMTYNISEAWNPDGLVVEIISNNTTTSAATEGVDYKIDLSKFDSSKAGTTTVDIVPTNSDFATKTLTLTVREQKEAAWKSVVFGASSGGVSGGKGSSVSVNGDKVTLTSWNGSGKITGDHDGIAYYYTHVNPDDNFKISADVYVRGYLGTHPGSSPGYYNVDEKHTGQESFGIMARDVIPLKGIAAAGYNESGDAYVYRVDGTFYTYDGEVYTDHILAGYTDAAKSNPVYDVYAVTDSNGNKSYYNLDGSAYTGAEIVAFGDDAKKGLTTVSFLAQKDDDGNPIPLNTGTDFCSNIAIAGGYSGSSYPTDTTSASYEKNKKLNRINLYARTGVTAINGGGTKNGPQAISTEYPHAGLYANATSTKLEGTEAEQTRKGDTYRITLERVNVLSDMETGAITRRGLKATCTYLDGEDESRIGETMETYMSDEVMNNIFSIQSDKDAYIGFFAARWAIIDVTNFEASVSDPATDPVYNVVEDEEVVPALSISSQLYTTVSDYTLIIKANNTNGGFLTLKRGDEVLYYQMKIGKKKVRLPITLNENTANNFTAIYTPSKLDNLSSYKDVVKEFTVYHRTVSFEPYYYVSPDGKSDAAGTREDPIDLVTAIGYVNPGQTIIMLDGTYNFDERIDIDLGNDGYKDNVKSLIADEGAHPVIDFGGNGAGFYLAGNYWYVNGIEITGSSDNQPGFELGGKNCTIENVKTHDNGGTGFQVSRVSSSQEYFEDWPSNNIIKNCETWNNADSTKINADGFGCKLTVGNGNVFDGCISHHNADDGWDLYTKKASGAIGETTLVNCASYKNGYQLVNGKDKAWGAGGHNGLKMGGESIYVYHYIKDVKSFMNEAAGSGVSSNNNPAMKVRNCVFYANESNGMNLYSGAAPDQYNYDVKGAISFKNGGLDEIGGVLNKDLGFVNHAQTDVANEESNYLMRKGTDSTTPSGEVLDPEAMFITTDYDAVTTGGRFEQLDDGSYDFKGFLERKEAYVHDAADAVVEYGAFYDDSANNTTVTETSTETTTKKTNSNGGGGSSSSSSSTKKSTGSASSKASGTESSTVTAKPGVPKGDGKDNNGGGNTTDINNNKFSDISSRPWAVEAINALSDMGVINGVGNGKFDPDAKAKRADFMVMFVKLVAGDTPIPAATDNFDDVPAGAYYADAVGFAKELGLTTGVGNNKFNPTATISRQDIMVIVARALELADVNLDKDTSVLDHFADADSIADYAKPYVAALVNLGIVSGTGNNIEPASDITRAQMAVLLYNVVKASDEVEQPAEDTTPTVTEEAESETTDEASETKTVAE